ncbi:hypothetical protein V501_06042 [Pseudogymnoascus sp. VKM F-4519 (FW-2642)]|nr:hypothetical protein V501_06042 [Pseudogymnoascus sp. VKM F-4519 (FW-2642)]
MGSYEDAIRLLNGRREPPKANPDEMRGSDDMLPWLRLLGHSDETLNSLNAIHIAGTKGKGSTCTFIASFLRAHGQRCGYPRKIGLYTSPHMNHIRERIRINDEPISKDLFASHFFEIWEKLPREPTKTLDIPRYLQLLALLAFHVFIKAGVDVGIFETHAGGKYDATNVIKTPCVTAVTSIGMDHARLLGHDIQDIARHKAGIFKSGCPAFSVLQEPMVTAEFEKQALKEGVLLKFVDLDDALPTNAAALKPVPQRINCSLALTVAREWLRQKAPDKELTAEDIICGIEQFSWPGRFQQITHGRCQWFLDCAHNELSLPYAATWFAEAITENQNGSTHPPRILIFSHFSDRDGQTLLNSIAKALETRQVRIQHLILTTYDIRRDGQASIDRNMTNRYKPEIQSLYAHAWGLLDPATKIWEERTIEEALDRAKDISTEDGMQVFVTGSIKLVSGALSLL